MTWEHGGVCLGPGPPGSFDEGGVSARCVVADPAQDGHWIMFYEARDAAGRRTIGQARSTNGETWKRREQPVFEPGSGGWDGEAVGQPWLVPLDDGEAMLYYLAEGKEGSGLGVACSDGADWTKWTCIDPDGPLQVQ